MKKRGFAVIDKTLQRQISSKGGKSAQALGTAHKWTSEEAKAAGRLGALKSRDRMPSDELRKKVREGVRRGWAEHGDEWRAKLSDAQRRRRAREEAEHDG